MDDLIHAAYGSKPPAKRADPDMAAMLAHECLLSDRIPKSEVIELAYELHRGPMPYSTHDLAVSVALNFFRRSDCILKLNSRQIDARMQVLQWYEEGKVVPLLLQSFEDTLYRLYKPVDTEPISTPESPSVVPSSAPGHQIAAADPRVQQLAGVATEFASACRATAETFKCGKNAFNDHPGSTLYFAFASGVAIGVGTGANAGKEIVTQILHAHYDQVAGPGSAVRMQNSLEALMKDEQSVRHALGEGVRAALDWRQQGASIMDGAKRLASLIGK